MNQLDETRLRTHVPIVAWALILSGALFLAIAVFVFMLLAGIGLVSGDPDAQAVLSIVGLATAFFLGALSVPGIVAGAGLLWRKNWGRILAIVISVLNLVNFPIGTLIGGYALFVLFQDAAGAYFEREQPVAEL